LFILAKLLNQKR